MKKICVIVAVIMCVSAGITNVWGESSNSVNKVVNVKDGTPLTDVYMKIQPKDEVETDSVIYIDFENAKVFEQDVIDGTASSNEIGYKKGGYQYKYADWSDEGFYDLMPDVSTNELPYKIRRMSKTQIEVTLINVPVRYANTSLATLNGINKQPVYSIPMVVSADGVGNITASIDSNGTSISGGGVSGIASSVAGSGTTSATIDSVAVGNDEIKLDTLTIKESAAGTFKTGSNNVVKLSLNSGFQFKGGTTFTVTAGSNVSFNMVSEKVETNTGTVSFSLPSDFKYTGNTAAGSIKIKGLVVVPKDENKNWGDIYLTINGGGISNSSLSTKGAVTTEETTETTTITTTQNTTQKASEGYNKSVSVQIGSNKVYVAGKQYDVDVMPYIQLSTSSTMVPLRVVTVALGGDINNADNSDIIKWDETGKTVTINYMDKTIIFTADSNKIIIDGEEVIMANGAVAEIKAGRMYVPFRALGEALGAYVDWNAVTKTAMYVRNVEI